MDPATQYVTPHGILRTLLHPEQTTPARLAVRYDAQRLVLALVMGSGAVALGDQVVAWLWDAFPAPETEAQDFSALLHEFLQGDARSIDDSDEMHSLVVGAITREVEAGQIWLGWLGTSGVRALNTNREPLAISKGLVAGEAWSPKQGIVPDHAYPHAEVVPINTVERLLVFSNVLRTVIDEIPYLGRLTLQRVAEAHATEVPAVLFDLRPDRVVQIARDVYVRYRWDAPHQATLFWSGGVNATGYRVEQATTPTFGDATIIAELTDARQRVYRVQPPVASEVYYRIVPLSENVIGQPSPPIVVTPVPLVSPMVDQIDWLPTGGFRIAWTDLPQADHYELEGSPDPEFDSPQTVIVYQGENPFYETEANFPGGWYFRARSRNTHFAPDTPSLWGQSRQAPGQLTAPVFEQVSPAKISWEPIEGAVLYQVRELESRDDEPEFVLFDTFIEPSFIPPRPTVYQVRALRAEDDENLAGPWSDSVSVGIWEGTVVGVDVDADTAKIPMLDNVKTITMDISQPGDPSFVETGSKIWRLILITAALAVGVGLIAGLIGGPRLGIGLDPTVTPVPRLAREATATQLQNFRDSAEQLPIVEQRLNEAQAVATENANTITNQQTVNTTLSDERDSLQQTATANANQISQLNDEQAVLEADLDGLQQTATQSSESYAAENAQLADEQATLEANLDGLQQTATQSSESYAAENAQLADEQATLEVDLDSLQQTATQSSESYAAESAQLADGQATLEADLDSLQQTATQSAESYAAENSQLTDELATQAASISQLNSVLAQMTTQEATASARLRTVEAELAANSEELDNLYATATAQAETITTLEGQIEAYEGTMTAVAPTPTPTPTPPILPFLGG